MAGRDYHHEEADDHLLTPSEAPAADHGEATTAQGGNDHATQSLAEIDFQYSGPAAEGPAAAGPPGLDQLSLHGAAPAHAHAHVDPAATAVAQAELETGTGAAAAKDEHAAEATDTAGPETGTVGEAAPAGGQTVRALAGLTRGKV